MLNSQLNCGDVSELGTRPPHENSPKASLKAEKASVYQSPFATRSHVEIIVPCIGTVQLAALSTHAFQWHDERQK